MKTTSLICGLLLSTTMPIEKKQSWVVTQCKNGITTYQSTAEESNCPTRSEMIVNAPIRKVTGVIADINNYKNWVPYCKTSKCVDAVSDNEKYCYQLISVPMIKDRDVVFRMTVKKTDETNYTIRITSSPAYLPKSKNALRIEHLLTTYTVTAVSDKQTKIVQENSVALGGSIPDFMLNWANKNQPYETFKALRTEIVSK